MNLWVILAAALFLGSVLISQKIAVDAASKLDDQTRLRIMKIFPKRNMQYTVAVYSVLLLFLIGLYYFPEHALKLWLIYAAFFAVYFITKFTRTIRTLKEIDAPGVYVGSIATSYFAFSAGAILAFVVLLVSGFGRAY
jgi:hypothetical protein